MWATTKSNKWLFHAVYELNGEQTAVCNKRVKAWLDLAGYEGTSTREDIELASTLPTQVVGSGDGRKRMRNYKICARCEKKAGKPAEDSTTQPETAPVVPEQADATVVSLLAAGYDDATHHLARMADVVRGWLAEEVDPFEVGGMLDIIASKHARQA